ncbi:nuclear transport factor 2 family protein [Streptomycetaceae bacterium NBC_01309]
MAAVSADLYVEVQMFYARQIAMLDGGDFEGFAGTFLADGVFRPAGGRAEVSGREIIAKASEAASGRFEGAQPRHWFDMLRVMPEADGGIRTNYYAAISVTAADGSTRWEPTCVVEDELVRTDGQLANRSRTVVRDDLSLH